jgi:hypothetical protein
MLDINTLNTSKDDNGLFCILLPLLDAVAGPLNKVLFAA